MVLQWTLWIIGLSLQFLVASALLAGPVREYLPVFAYTLILFFTTVVEIIATFDQGGRLTREWASIFWICEFIRQAGLYGVVVSSVVRAVPEPKKRIPVARALVVL